LRERAIRRFNKQEWVRALALRETENPHPTESNALPVPPSPKWERAQMPALSLLTQ
jgi:hypothetical protein